MRLQEIAGLIGARILGNPQVEITGVSSITEAGPGDITFLASKRYLDEIYRTKASAVIVKEELKDLPVNMLVVENPLLAFAKVLEVFHKRPSRPPGISNKAIIGQDVVFGPDVTIYPSVYIDDNVTIGKGVTIFPHVYIGHGVSIGDDSTIYPNVTIRENVTVGRRVIIHPGAVIGADGFGYVAEGGIHHKIPQIGGVIIGNDVEVGANVTIDRAMIGNTVIGNGTKIDNLVQIGHNVKIGKNCIIVAQVGIGGSAEISDGVILAGQVGVKDHVKIGRNVMVGAKSGVLNDIPDGQVVTGLIAIPHKAWLRSQGIYKKLPEYIRRLQELEKKVKNLTKKEEASDDG